MPRQRGLIQSILQPSSQSASGFVPFLHERDSIGRILQRQQSSVQCSSGLSLKLVEAQKVVKKYYQDLERVRKSKHFNLEELQTSSVGGMKFKAIGFKGLRKKRVEKPRESIDQPPRYLPRLFHAKQEAEVCPFYDRNNYEKFFHKKAPSAFFPQSQAHREDSQAPQAAASAQPQQKLANSQVRERSKPKQRNHFQQYFEEQARRKELINRLQSKLYPQVENELRRIEGLFTSLKNQALSLKNQTSLLKHSVVLA